MIQTKGLKVIVLVVSGLILAGRVHSCPNDWIGFGDKCYRFSQGALSWGQALIVCKALGGTLAEPRHHVIDRFLRDEVRHLKMKNAWVGLSDQFKEGHFEWESDGSRLDYTMFSYTNPDNDDGREHCVQLWKHHGYLWNDNNCHLRNPFVCEKKGV